jgi:hypothetical protein
VCTVPSRSLSRQLDRRTLAGAPPRRQAGRTRRGGMQ